MAEPGHRRGRDFIARHGETVYNLARRIQGDHPHTPLTRAGFAQADAMGAALAERLGPSPRLTLWASPTGRALQALAVMAERLGLDWHQVRTDGRLREIGMGDWGGRYYADVFAAGIARIDPDTGFLSRAPHGEHYHEIAERVSGWLADTAGDADDRLVVSHGVTSRVLRGVVLGLPPIAAIGAPLAPGLPQGSVVLVGGGREELVLAGTGQAPAT